MHIFCRIQLIPEGPGCTAWGEAQKGINISSATVENRTRNKLGHNADYAPQIDMVLRKPESSVFGSLCSALRAYVSMSYRGSHSWPGNGSFVVGYLTCYIIRTNYFDFGVLSLLFECCSQACCRMFFAGEFRFVTCGGISSCATSITP